MLRIGLTGGIGSGKTAASDHFSRLGATVIDTDLLSRELVEPGQPALAEIVDTFGTQILDRSGALDRTRLRERVFGDPADRKRLESILHPAIRKTMLERAERAETPYVVFVVPLLIETGQQGLVDRILLIDVPEEIQRQRVEARDSVNNDQVSQILAAQTDRKTRLGHADDVLVNDGDLAELEAKVEELHRDYLQRAHN